MITAKVQLIQKNASVVQVALTFAADYNDGRNKEWAQWTPSLNLSMTVKPEVADRFELGGAYTLTFTPEESGDGQD